MENFELNHVIKKLIKQNNITEVDAIFNYLEQEVEQNLLGIITANSVYLQEYFQQQEVNPFEDLKGYVEAAMEDYIFDKASGNYNIQTLLNRLKEF